MKDPDDIRSCLLGVIADSSKSETLQSSRVLKKTGERLGVRNIRTHDEKMGLEQAILASFHDLLRTGYLAWGVDLQNDRPPFFHVTERGQKSIVRLSRDPANPAGYLEYLAQSAKLDPIVESYVKEAVACFIQDLPRAAAVMVGAAAESTALTLRDLMVSRLEALSQTPSNKLEGWRIKTVLDAMQSFFETNKKQMPRELFDAFTSYWPAFFEHIRSARNEAGHPSSVDPVTTDTVHASLLIFPELAKLADRLAEWLSSDYK